MATTQSTQVTDMQAQNTHTIPTQPLAVAELKPQQEQYDIVSYDVFDMKNMRASSPDQKTAKGKSDKGDEIDIKYYIIMLTYNYGIPGQPRISDFYLEGCELESNGGIIDNTAKGRGFSIMTRLSPSNPEHVKFENCINHIYGGCCYIIGQNKGTLGMRSFDPAHPGETFKNPIYIPYDKITCDPIPGRDHTMFLKLFRRGFGVMEEKTLFTDLNGKPIDWTLLMAVKMKFIPLLYIKRIYSGNKPSLQIELQSALVTSVQARNTQSMQMETARRIMQSRPEAVDRLQAQIAKLTTDRGAQLSSVKESPSPVADGAPTYAGLIANGAPSEAEQSAEDDFLNRAPTHQIPKGITILQ